ncbi:four-helix bundle copper-binding protein, partial [Acinetobacter sp. 11520]|nr:four-helix bundle copper-binding protein [Acinetobacter sp. 11520]
METQQETNSSLFCNTSTSIQACIECMIAC